MKFADVFIKNEDGMETLEFLVILAVVAVLFGIVISVGRNIKTKGTAVANSLDNYAKTGN